MKASDLDILPQDYEHWLGGTLALVDGKPAHISMFREGATISATSLTKKALRDRFPTDSEDDGMRAVREVSLRDISLWWPDEGYYQIFGKGLLRPGQQERLELTRAILLLRRVARVYKKSCNSRSYTNEYVEPWYVPDRATFEWQVLSRNNVFTGIYPYVTQIHERWFPQKEQIYDLLREPSTESLALSKLVALVRSPDKADDHVWAAVYGLTRTVVGLLDIRHNTFDAEKGGAVLSRVVKRLPDGVRVNA